MRIILAETGCDYNIESVENNEEISMATLKETIEEISDISVTDQILITASGIQLKESNNKTWLKDDHHPSKAIVVFNRRLLETDHSADYLIHTTIPRLSKNLMELDLPELKQLEEMIELHEEENRDRELWELLAHVCQTCVDISFHRRTVIEKITREIDAQVIALHAALNNLESHVRTAYQTITKFDRIGQREFSRLAISIGSIDLDIELMRNVEIHPYLKHLLGYDELSLASYISIEGLEMHKHKILRNYDELVSATLDEKNSLNRLNQQAAEFNKNRASSDHLLQRTKKIRSEAYRLTESIQDTQKKMTDGIRRRKKIAELKQRINLTEEETEIKSSWTPDYFRDALKALYMNDAFIHEAEQAILSEKQTSIINLVNTLQSISVVEESLATIYPRLADLERSIKALRFDIERGKGAMARRMIAGYGFLLIESWRRYTYSEIRTKHQIPVDHQLENQEMQYRNTFESELIYLDTLNVFESEDKMEEGQAILPISFKDNLVNSSDDSWIITRKEVEEYIQLVQSFYANNSVHEEKKRRSSITSANEDTIPRDISTLLYSRLDREIKRLGQGVQILDGVLRPEALKVPQFKVNKSVF
ncbi:hypothetical protein BDB01DRAFT_789619 [Pilobolus umbonatus]|nr:hypothetical protein BDB01DRAFT_789619 [Pilobolus umbonatus]